MLAALPAQAQAIRYVDADATGAGDGTSWADAFPHLQAALAVAGAGDQVWVAEGTYKPTDGGPDPAGRTATFVLPNGVGLYGGFAGTEEALNERNWTVYETILSGDIGVVGDSLDNSYHVVTASGTDSTTVLDGVAIVHGRADKSGPSHSRGGGIVIEGGSPRLRNLVIRWNGGREGGGLYSEGGAPLLEGCLFEDNLGIGGGAYFEGGDPTIREVIFRGNADTGAVLVNGSRALIEDGVFEGNRSAGMLIVDSSPVIRRTVFRGNSAGRGAGVLMYANSEPLAEPLFEDCLFENNTAHDAGGGGVYSGAASPTFVRTTFRNNTAPIDSGGGARVRSGVLGGSPAYFINSHFEGNKAPAGSGLYSYLNGTVVINSVFTGNRATGTNVSSGGGGVYVAGGVPGFPVVVANTLFVGNTGTYGGGVRVLASGQTEVRFVNVTITGNTATQAGGGLHFSDAPGLRLQNTIIWGNYAPEGPDVFYLEGLPPTFEHSIIGGGCPPVVTCHHVLDADPLFVRNPDPGPDGQWGSADDDYGDLRLQPGSPAEDFGLEAYLPRDRWDLDGDGDTEEPLPIDLGGGPRVIGAEVDAGAYEGVYPVGAQAGPALETAPRVAVYPNPVRGVAVVDVTVGAEVEVSVGLFDVLGRRVALLYAGMRRPGTTPLVVEVPSSVPSGAYVVRVTGAGSTSPGG